VDQTGLEWSGSNWFRMEWIESVHIKSDWR